MEDAGWAFFFMAGESKASALGFNRADALRNALAQLTRRAGAQHCNALEITRITAHRFLGLSHVSIAVHLLNLQKESLLFGNEHRGWANRFGRWED
jgi:hypothetical protein